MEAELVRGNHLVFFFVHNKHVFVFVNSSEASCVTQCCLQFFKMADVINGIRIEGGMSGDKYG